MPAIIQTPSAEFERCRRGARLYRLDQPRNPLGDPAEEPALFGRQFVQFPNGCQIPVHIYSMPNVELTSKLNTQFSAPPPAYAPRLYESGSQGACPQRQVYRFVTPQSLWSCI